jgi:HEAT repeat protein
MRSIALTGICAFVLISSNTLLGQQPPTAVSSPQTSSGAKQQPAGTSQANDTAPAPASQPPVSQASPPTAAPEIPQTPKEQAWQILDSACSSDKTGEHATAIRVLGLIPNDAKALSLAQEALGSEKAEIRAAAAAALGDLKSKSSIPKLKTAAQDNDPLVALAAANSLNLMHDPSAYEVYYEVLARQRKAGKGMIASETSILKDPKKMAQLGFEEGIGFIPFAGIGWGAVKTITKDDTSPVRAAAAKVLASDPDPATTRALENASGDKSWLVRVAALEALAKRGDPSALHTVALRMSDEKVAVKYTAAAAVLRLTAVKEGRAARTPKKIAHT